MMRALIIALMGLVALGCSDEAEEEEAGAKPLELVPCDPLLPVDVPTELGTVIAVGQDAAGTLYVVDRHESTPNDSVGLFVSDGDTLVRQDVAGSGQTPGYYVLTVLTPAYLKIKIEGEGDAMQIAVLHDDCECKDFEVASADEVLETLPLDAANGFAVQNLPGEIVSEYWGTVEDGRRLLVTRTLYDWDGTVRLFLGPPDAIAEHRVESFSRGVSTTYINFEAPDTNDTVFVPRNVDPTLGPAYVTHGGQQLALTLEETPPADSDAFRCIAP